MTSPSDTATGSDRSVTASGGSARRAVVAVGVGVAAFLVVAVAVTELASSVVEFSLLLGLPAGLVAGAAGTLLVFAALTPAATRGLRAGTAGAAAFGYAVLVLWAARYAVAATQSALTVPAVAGLAVVAGAVVAAAVWWR